CNRLRKRLCIFDTIIVTLKKVTYAIRIRELCSWTPSLLEEDSIFCDEGCMEKFEEEDAKSFEDNDAASGVGILDDIGV
ncbi:hypothetical protein Tco_1452749, partial [Tanacetum coccineum]